MKKLRKVRTRRIDTVEAYSCVAHCNSLCLSNCRAGDLSHRVRTQNDLNRWRQVAG